jgi:hypothetical protein
MVVMAEINHGPRSTPTVEGFPVERKQQRTQFPFQPGNYNPMTAWGVIVLKNSKFRCFEFLQKTILTGNPAQ